MSGFSNTTRHIIFDRDCGQCFRCGRLCLYWDDVRWVRIAEYSIQHRRPRGMGGSYLASTNAPTNGVILCGSATTPGSCHYWAEETDRTQAYDDGFLVHQGIDPATIPVRHHSHGLVYLTNEGYEGAAA
jgi:hypothetical protein